MPPEVDALLSHARPLCPSGRALARSPLAGGPIALVHRDLPAAVAAALDAVAPERLPRLRLRGAPEHMAAALKTRLHALGFGPPPELADWLAEDVAALAKLYRSVTGAARVVVRLERVSGDACCRFHADNVRARLVCTYRGPGTEWLSPRMVARAPAGAPLPESAIRQLPRGAVAFLRGTKEDGPALLHRSPPISGTGLTRLFLAIDAEADPAS